MNQEKVLKLQALAPAEYLTGDEVIDLSHPSIRRFAGTLRAPEADFTCRANISSSGKPLAT